MFAWRLILPFSAADVWSKLIRKVRTRPLDCSLCVDDVLPSLSKVVQFRLDSVIGFLAAVETFLFTVNPDVDP